MTWLQFFLCCPERYGAQAVGWMRMSQLHLYLLYQPLQPSYTVRTSGTYAYMQVAHPTQSNSSQQREKWLTEAVSCKGHREALHAVVTGYCNAFVPPSCKYMRATKVSNTALRLASYSRNCWSHLVYTLPCLQITGHSTLIRNLSHCQCSQAEADDGICNQCQAAAAVSVPGHCCSRCHQQVAAGKHAYDWMTCWQHPGTTSTT